MSKKNGPFHTHDVAAADRKDTEEHMAMIEHRLYQHLRDRTKLWTTLFTKAAEKGLDRHQETLSSSWQRTTQNEILQSLTTDGKGPE